MTSIRQILIRTSFVTLALLNTQAAFGQHEKHSTPAKESRDRHGEPYYLPTCPISGERLGGMGDPIVKVYDGREIRFCCKECPPKFEKSKDANFAKIDEQIIKDQLPLYPLKTSLVSGKDLPPKPYEFVFGNRLIRVLDKEEKDLFLKEPDRYMEQLNKEVVTRQSKGYASATCPVSGEKLGAMGKPVDVVLAGRLVRLCCSECKKDLEKTPSEFLAKVDAARRKATKD